MTHFMLPYSKKISVLFRAHKLSKLIHATIVCLCLGAWSRYVS